MNVAGIRRNIKNLAHNYTDAQVKVREATSNDPWGPPSTLMSEISDLTYNVVAFSEIMQMIWKRLNDHGKNYRHVYKALVLLDYLVKNGNEKVAQQCKENIFAIHTLRDFQYYEEGKDQGVNVREKAKQLEALLKDEERLKNERAKALKARERFAQQTTSFGFGSDSNIATSRSESFGSDPGRSRPTFPPSDLDLARPQTAGEEELQLQLALAMSREEAEKEEERRRSDDVRLALAISQSQENQGRNDVRGQQQPQQESHLLDLLDVNLSGNSAGWVDPWGTPAHPADPPAPAMPPRPKVKSDFPSPGARPPTDAWGMPIASSSPAQVDPWGSPIPPANATTNSSIVSHARSDPWSPAPAPATAKPASDPWSPQPPVRTAASANDPWSPQGPGMQPSTVGVGSSSNNGDIDEFELLTNRNQGSSPLNRTVGNPSYGAATFDLSTMDDALIGNTGAKPKKSPESFLGPNSNLVNLENLVPTKPSVPAANPFTLNSGQPNPFQQPPAPRPSINELRNQQNFGPTGGVALPIQPATDWNGSLTMGMSMTQGIPVAGGAIAASGQATSPTLNPFLA